MTAYEKTENCSPKGLTKELSIGYPEIKGGIRAYVQCLDCISKNRRFTEDAIAPDNHRQVASSENQNCSGRV
jgi:hypothetical protein